MDKSKLELRNDLTLEELIEGGRVADLPCEKHEPPTDCSGEGYLFESMCATCQEYWTLAASHTKGATPEEVLEDFRTEKEAV